MRIPSVQLQTVVESAAAVVIANRDPEPAEVQVPLFATIRFDSWSAINSITINGSLTDDTTAWNRVDTSLADGGIHVEIRNLHPFLSGQTVTVSVSTVAGITTWTFVAYDITAPLFAGVVAIAENQLRVTFNEAVDFGTLNPGDALNPSTYFIERVSRPAATPPIRLVEPRNSAELILTTGFELTFGAQYMLVVTGLRDEFGNVFAAPDNVFRFTGWVPEYPAGRRWLLHDFVPRFMLGEDNTDDLRLFLACLQDTVNICLHSVDRWIHIIDPDLAPEDFVDAMLADLGNPFQFDLSLLQKRKLAKTLVGFYQLKGTTPGIIAAVLFFTGIAVTVETFTGIGWRLGYDRTSTEATSGGIKTYTLAPSPAIVGGSSGALYSFRIRTAATLTTKQREMIQEIGTYMKGAPEHLIEIRDASYVAPVINPPPVTDVGTITSFILASPALPGVITVFDIGSSVGVIDQSTHTIEVTVSDTTDVTAVAPTVQTTNGASYTPEGERDFTNPVVYTVHSLDGSTTNYTVTVIVLATSIYIPELNEVLMPCLAIWSVYENLGYDYTGPLFRLRRASDGAEQDIGFAPDGGRVNMSAIGAFCGSSVGSVARLYDLSQHGRDLIQPTATAQPRIYDGTALLLQGDKLTLELGNGAFMYRNDSSGYTLPRGNSNMNLFYLGTFAANGNLIRLGKNPTDGRNQFGIFFDTYGVPGIHTYGVFNFGWFPGSAASGYCGNALFCSWVNTTGGGGPLGTSLLQNGNADVFLPDAYPNGLGTFGYEVDDIYTLLGEPSPSTVSYMSTLAMLTGACTDYSGHRSNEPLATVERNRYDTVQSWFVARTS